MVLRADLPLVQSVPTEIRQLDLNQFHLDLRDLEDDPDGRPWPKTHTHSTTVTVGGVTLARVVQILDPYTVTFEDGQYAVNLEGANSNVSDKANVNQVSIRSANSAGLVDLEVLVSAAQKTDDIHGQVARAVFIDAELVTNGNGYQQTPFNNWTDAVDYAEANGLKRLVVLSDATIDRQLKNFVITGVGTPTIDCNGQNLDKSEISRCTLTGLYSGRLVAQDCSLVGVFSLNGFFENCAMGSEFKVPDGGIAFVKDCSAFVVGQVPPVFDVGGATGTGVLVVTGWMGGFKLINVNQATDDVKLIHSVSKVILDPSCTDGGINIEGVTRLIDNSAGSVVVDETLDPEHLHEVWTRLGLDRANPFTDTPALFSSADDSIRIDVTGDGETTTTQARQ